MATTQIEAIEQKTIVQIEMSCLQVQEQLALAGLSTDAAKEFIAALPSIETLMPLLSLAEIEGEAEPPIAEQLVSSNALRSFQVWRYRLIKVRHRIPTVWSAKPRLWCAR